jgi:hypothetical protein
MGLATVVVTTSSRHWIQSYLILAWVATPHDHWQSFRSAARDFPISPHPPPPKTASNLVVLVNFLQAFFAVVLGNVAYFLLAPSLHLPRHHPFQADWGLMVDFWFCAVAYGLIRTARKWR